LHGGLLHTQDRLISPCREQAIDIGSRADDRGAMGNLEFEELGVRFGHFASDLPKVQQREALRPTSTAARRDVLRGAYGGLSVESEIFSRSCLKGVDLVLKIKRKNHE